MLCEQAAPGTHCPKIRTIRLCSQHNRSAISHGRSGMVEDLLGPFAGSAIQLPMRLCIKVLMGTESCGTALAVEPSRIDRNRTTLTLGKSVNHRKGRAMAVQTRRGKIWDDKLQDMASASGHNLEEGAVTSAYSANREEVIQLLNRALASEWIAFMQYWHHYFMATDIHSAEIKEFFKEAASEELHHIDEIGSRIQLLGGVPCDKPDEVTQQWPMPVEYGHDLRNMLECDLKAERMTVSFYSEIVRFCGFGDIITRSLFEEILREEEEHANNLADLLYAVDASSNQPISSLHQQIEEKVAQRGMPTRRAA